MAACLLALSGCTSFPWRKVPLDAASGLYADAALTYRVDAGKLGQPLDVVRIEGQRITCEQVASSPVPDESIGTLTIQYPHPAGREGTALARFTLDSASTRKSAAPAAWNPFRQRPIAETPTTIVGAQPEIHEVWELDIPHGELDQIVKMLANAGFYHSQRPGPAHLSVRMNGVEQERDWEQLPALNLFIQRVRSQGRLVTYSRASAATGAADAAIASTGVYRELMARGHMPGTPGPQLASAFALPQLAAPGTGAPPMSIPPAIPPVMGPPAIAPPEFQGPALATSPLPPPGYPPVPGVQATPAFAPAYPPIANPQTPYEPGLAQGRPTGATR
ncbi:MAG: hypothetical protein AB7O59_06300 [Pirellulales bacterium]